MRLALVVALATAEVKVETKPKPCKKLKCFGRKDPAPRSPYFAPRGRGARACRASRTTTTSASPGGRATASAAATRSSSPHHKLCSH